MMDNAEKKRRPNFTEDEVRAIAHGVAKRLPIINGKFSASLTNTKKIDAWQQITEEVNACSPCIRTVNEIKIKYKAYKSVAKKDVSSYRRKVTQTGLGGPPPEMPNELNQMVVNLLPAVAMEGLPGGVEVGGGLDIINLPIDYNIQNIDIVQDQPEALMLMDEQVQVATHFVESGTQTTMSGPTTSSTIVEQGERMLEAISEINTTLRQGSEQNTLILTRLAQNETSMINILSILQDIIKNNK